MDFLSYNRVDLTLWDVAWQMQARQLWQHYFENTDALIFVVDSQDRTRLGEARKELETVLEDERLTGADLLVMSNKTDLPGGVSAEELWKELGLLERSERRWHIQAFQFQFLNILLQHIEHYKRFRLDAKSISRVFTTKYQNTKIHTVQLQ